MKVKNFYSKGILILLLIMAMVIPKIPVGAASSTMIQVGKMKLEFRGKDTVVLKEVMTNSKNVPEPLTYDNIKKVIIAEGIKTLPDYMFLRFPNTETIEFSSSLNNFSAINGHLTLQKLKSILVSEKNKEYKSIDGILYSKDGKELIYYPYGKKTTKFIVPDTVTTVSIENIYLKDITLGAKVTDLYTFRLPALVSIHVSSKNIKFISQDGVLFSKDKRELIEYPSSKGKKYTVPDGTTKIMNNAFNSSNVEKVTLPEGLIFIGTKSFANTKIKSITFPKSLFIYQKDSFLNSELTHVYVHKENGVLSSQDGIVYNKEKTLLHFWPQARVEENLVFPDTLTLLDLSMIKTIEKSNTITIPSALTSILNTANNQFNKVYLSKGNTSFVLNQGILYSSNMTMIKLYPNKNPITKIVLPDEVIYLDKEMFIKENTTTSLTLSKKLKQIVLLPYSMRFKEIGFYNLTEVLIPEENPNYTSVDGILYSKDMKTLNWYPDNSPIKVFKIPDSVTSIDSKQLRNAANLEELYIPANLSVHNLLYEHPESSIDMSNIIGFRCPKLEKITVHENNKELEAVDGVLYSKGGSKLLLYPSSKNDKKFMVPSNVSVINAFSYNNYLEEIILPKTLHSTYDYYSREYNMFLNFTALKTINIDQWNKDFSVRDGVLYSKDFTFLIAYPIAKEDKTVVLDSKIRYLLCEKNLKYALNLKEILLSNNKYWFSQKGSLYREEYSGYTLYITPGSEFVEHTEYLSGFNHGYEKLEIEDNTTVDSFQGIKKELIDFTLPDTYYVFKENSNIYNGEKTVYIIDDTKPLTDYFDKNAEGVETLYIAEGVTRIPELIYALFPNVQVLNIPSTCYLIDNISEFDLQTARAIQNAFLKLSAINISPENDWFASVDGVVYSRDFKNVHIYPINKTDRSYSIPNATVDITLYATSTGQINPYLEEIKVGASMQSPPFSILQRYFPNLKSAELNSYNKFFSIIKGKMVTMQEYR